ncbi:hypothetical protein BDF19DRAFT_426498 [Syncephalis fuscata]|nr:hypothetical protein BDF19DRAFT_426498 [Syncephalis fuscata]
MTTEAYGCAYPDCNAVFTVPHALLYHFKRCHIGQAAPLERPFRCAMPGCLKRYKNLNGFISHCAKDQHNLRGQNTALNSGPFNVNVFPMSDNYATVTATAAAATTVEENKPFRCAVPGCPKAYRNPNGLEYHMRHAHLDLMPASLVDEITARRPRPFRCTSKGCGRRYMSPNGLHYHIRNMHPEQEDELMSSLRNQSAQPSSSQNSQSTKHQGNILVWRQEKST